MNHTLNYVNLPPVGDYGLRLLQCGCLSARNVGSSTPLLYERYVLSFVVQGRGQYVIDGSVYDVAPGTGFLTAPNSTTNWVSDKDLLQYIFVILDGRDLKQVLRDVGLGTESRIFRYAPAAEPLRETLFSMFNACYGDRPTYACMGYFYLVLQSIARMYQDRIPAKTMTVGEYYKNALAFIDSNYGENISVQDIADFVHIDRTYLYKIFKQETNRSPSAFLLEYRLQKAVQMMQAGGYSNNSIALAVGFYDYSHFAHAFRKQYGMSPQQFLSK